MRALTKIQMRWPLFILLFLLPLAGRAFSCCALDDSSPSFFLFSGSSNPELASAIAKELNMPLGRAVIGRFNDGEINIQIQENVRNKEVFVIQSTCRSKDASVNDSLMELFFLVRTLKRASAKTVTAVIPYYGYARQDRKVIPRVPISASDVAMMLEDAGVDRVIAVDLHCGQIQGFFHHAPVDNLYASLIFVPYFAKKELKNPVILSPDAGGVARAKEFRDKLAKKGVQTGFGVIIKQRESVGRVSQMDLVGDVAGSDVIIVDDLCDTGGTLVRAAEELKAFGAERIYACITHPVFSRPALERLGNSCFTEVVVTDSIPHSEEKLPPNVTKLSVAPLLAEVISCLYHGCSVAAVFEQNALSH